MSLLRSTPLHFLNLLQIKSICNNKCLAPQTILIDSFNLFQIIRHLIIQPTNLFQLIIILFHLQNLFLQTLNLIKLLVLNQFQSLHLAILQSKYLNLWIPHQSNLFFKFLFKFRCDFLQFLFFFLLEFLLQGFMDVVV